MKQSDTPQVRFRRVFSTGDRAEMRALLEDCIQRNIRGVLSSKIASDHHTYEKHPQMHYHFNAEVFVQQEGITKFGFPRESMVLRPGEMCVIPAGVPHKERITPTNGTFRNMVIAFYHDTISVHFAFEASPGRPDIEVIEFFFAPDIKRITDLVDLMVQVAQSGSPARDTAVRGLTLAFLSMILNAVSTGQENFNSEAGKVFQVKWLVREQLSNSSLSVKTLAERLQCSADYLSHLFHQSTNEKLVQYIQRKRIEGAKIALETTPLYVSEIAWSSGFADPAYFARVFKKLTGETPHSYRERIEQRRSEKDPRPKTVYHDRDDFSMGRPLKRRPPMPVAVSTVERKVPEPCKDKA